MPDQLRAVVLPGDVFFGRYDGFDAVAARVRMAHLNEAAQCVVARTAVAAAVPALGLPVGQVVGRAVGAGLGVFHAHHATKVVCPLAVGRAIGQGEAALGQGGCVVWAVGVCALA